MNSTQETITDGEPRKFDLSEITVPPEVPTVPVPEAPEVSDAAPLSGVDPVRYRNAVKRILSKPKRGKVLDPWALTTIAGKLEIAKIFSLQTVARIQLVDGLTVKQRLDAAIALGEEMINGTEGGALNAELRLKGIAIIAAAVKVSGEVSEQNMKLAEKAAVKGESGNGPRRKNLPPSTGIEMSIGEGADRVSARVIATNGNTPS